MKATEWIDRGKSSEDPIDAFDNYWRAFNNLYFDVRKGKETEKIRLYLQQKISQISASQMLSAHSIHVEYLLSQPVTDMRGNGKNTASNIQAFEAAPDALAKLEELFMVIYQIRCNLSHGQKSPSRERDITLCRSSVPLLDAVVLA